MHFIQKEFKREWTVGMALAYSKDRLIEFNLQFINGENS